MKVVPEDVFTAAPLAVLFREPQSTANKRYVCNKLAECSVRFV